MRTFHGWFLVQLHFRTCCSHQERIRMDLRGKAAALGARRSGERSSSRAILDADMLRMILWLLFTTSTPTIRIHLRHATPKVDAIFLHKYYPGWRLAVPSFGGKAHSAPCRSNARLQKRSWRMRECVIPSFTMNITGRTRSEHGDFAASTLRCVRYKLAFPCHN